MSKLKIVEFTSEDYESYQELWFKGECIYTVYDLSSDCPEDAIIGRSLKSASDIADILKKIYELNDQIMFPESETLVFENTPRSDDLEGTDLEKYENFIKD